MAIPLLQRSSCCLRHVHAATFIRDAESEITSLVPQAPSMQLSIVCSIRTASWAGAWEQDYSFSTQVADDHS